MVALVSSEPSVPAGPEAAVPAEAEAAGPDEVEAAVVADAERVQTRLRERLDLTNAVTSAPSRVAGVDVSYEVGTRRAAAAAVVVDVDTLETREYAIVYGEVTFPYVPGLLAFREAPIVMEALAKLTITPEVLVCDGYGIAHPRRFGLASISES